MIAAATPLIVCSYSAREEQLIELQISDGLVPLTIAARLAYDRLTPDEARVTTEEELSLLIPVIALSLSLVTTVVRRTGGEAPKPVQASELKLLMTNGAISDEAATTLFVQRSDLHKAIMTLQMCGAMFGASHGE